eukprot:scaffold148285_cov28-Cyclotella_meneghiniana.AAC.1
MTEQRPFSGRPYVGRPPIRPNLIAGLFFAVKNGRERKSVTQIFYVADPTNKQSHQRCHYIHILPPHSPHALRQQRCEANKPKRLQQRIEYLARHGKPSHPTSDEIKHEAENKEYRRMDETIELALQLNLDPRKPGQSLRGSLALPHGNGKQFAEAVFTDDDNLASQALASGAIAAGGSSLIESIQNGNTSL